MIAVQVTARWAVRAGRQRGVARALPALAVVAGLALAAGPPADAAPPAGAAGAFAPGSERAREALASAERALEGGGEGGVRAAGEVARPPRTGPLERPASEPTPALRDLALALPALRGSERARARRLLARPSDNADHLGNSWRAPEAPGSPHCSPRFCIHWVETTDDAPSLADADGSGVPDYVELTLALAERAFAVQNDELGWPPPVADGFGAPGAAAPRTDIYLAELGDRGLFGYAAPDPPPRQICRISCFAYLVLDNDYSPREYRYDDPRIPLSVTLAHEYNHVLQFGIDAHQDRWLFEATAVWAEEKVFPEVNDYVNYLRRFVRTSGAPITNPDAAGGQRIYAAGVWNHWLDSGARFGPGVVLETWLGSGATRPASYAVGAYDRAIRTAGGSGFAREFVEFAAVAAEWRLATSGFPDSVSYPDVRRQGAITPAAPQRFRLDHTSYRMFRVRARGPRALVLRLHAHRGVRAGLALVGRRGSSTGGSRQIITRFVRRGGTRTIVLHRPGRFRRLTAVVVNADGRVRGFTGIDWVYRRDDVEFTLRAARR